MWLKHYKSIFLAAFVIFHTLLLLVHYIISIQGDIISLPTRCTKPVWFNPHSWASMPFSVKWVEEVTTPHAQHDPGRSLPPPVPTLAARQSHTHL